MDPRPSIEEMARIMDRSVSSIQTEASRMNIRKGDVELRKCIPGQHMFWSTNVHNRICRSCSIEHDLEVA